MKWAFSSDSWTMSWSDLTKVCYNERHHRLQWCAATCLCVSVLIARKIICLRPFCIEYTVFIIKLCRYFRAIVNFFDFCYGQRPYASTASMCNGLNVDRSYCGTTFAISKYIQGFCGISTKNMEKKLEPIIFYFWRIYFMNNEINYYLRNSNSVKW